jgi:hypothetical protein
MKTFYFNTGVKPGIPSNERHIKGAKPVPLCDGQVWLNVTKQIPFDCDNVPEGATFQFGCDNPNLYPESSYIVREMHNTTMLSKYAYFTA